MQKCSYCEKDYEEYKGVKVVDSVSGDIKNFCSSKCRKNSEMRRKRKKWTHPMKKTSEDVEVKQEEKITKEDNKKKNSKVKEDDKK